MSNYKDLKHKNLVDKGTIGTTVATGTTAQRGSEVGQFRYNSTTGKFEGKNASAFISIEATPTVTSIDDTEVDSAGGGNQTIVITGTNFSTGDVASFVGSSANFNAATTTIDSATQITAVAPKSSFLNAQEPYGVRVTSAGGLQGNLASQINVDNAPTWTTASGNLGSIQDTATGTHFTLAASDAEGDTVAYTETGGTNITGAGMALASATGIISGDPTDVAANTTVSFDVRATAGGKTSDRTFNIIITPPPKLFIGSTGTVFSTSGNSASKSTYGYETITVSEDMSVYVDLWGAGGGTSTDTSATNNPTYGSAGGHAYGQITLLNGTTYVLLIGRGGRPSTTDRMFPDGGNMDNANNNRGSGGGSTRFGLYTQSGFNLTNSDSDYNNTNAVYQLIAGGGGGGSYYATWGGTPGGYGGGTDGAAGGGYYDDDGSVSPGSGASQSAGGAGGYNGRLDDGTAGAKYSGGEGTGTGGGGGYYGGGGSAGYYTHAGGGSGFINSSSGLLTNTGFQTASTYNVAPAGTRSNRLNGTEGNGGSYSSGAGVAPDGGVVFTLV
jgi:hypothetical protein